MTSIGRSAATERTTTSADVTSVRSGDAVTEPVAQPRTADVRAWAREQGRPVGERGRLAPDLVFAYVAAHPAGGQAAIPLQPSVAAAAAVAAGPTTARLPGRTVKAKATWDWQRRESSSA